MRGGLKRRGFFGLAALPAVARAATERRLVFVPQAMPVSLDPIATPSFATRTASMAVFDTLYGTDAALNALPQMVEQHRVEDGGKRWVMQLRAGLLFHDGTKVTARDCVASIRRWMRRDRVGQAFGARMDAMDATADDTLTIRLSKPMPKLPLMLTKSQMSPPVIMPESVAANTRVDVPVEKLIGSGPFRLANFTWKPGEDLDLLRFEKYVPRPDESRFTGGRRVALLDRVMWRMPADPVQALRDGSEDWVEWLPPDLQGDTLGDPGITVTRLDEVGYYGMLRLNALWGPTENQKIRQAILAGIDGTAVMEAVFGVDSGRFKAPVGLFPPGSEFVNNAGSDRIGATQSPRAIKAMLKDAGYNGEPFVVLNPIDDLIHTRMTSAAIDELKQIGVLVVERKMDRMAFHDWRERPRGPAEPGLSPVTKTGIKAGPADRDWSAVCDSVPCADHYDAFAISAGPGPVAGNWPGWPDDPQAAKLRDTMIDTPDLRGQRAVAEKLQAQVYATAAFVPLGEWFPTTGWRNTVTGPQKGCFPVFWDVARS